MVRSVVGADGRTIVTVGFDEVIEASDLLPLVVGGTLVNYGQINGELVIPKGQVTTDIINYGTISRHHYSYTQDVIRSDRRGPRDTEDVSVRVENYGWITGDVSASAIKNRGQLDGSLFADFELDVAQSTVRTDAILWFPGAIADFRGSDVFFGKSEGLVLLQGASVWGGFYAGDGDDIIRARGGYSDIIAGDGDDFIDARDGFVFMMDGGAGADFIDARNAIVKHEIRGGPGDDIFRIDEGTKILERASEGVDRVELWSGEILLSEHIEHLRLRGDALSGVGNYSDNQIVGNQMGNTLIGGPGDDWILGGPGADVIEDGIGSDTMWGGAHNDRFVLIADGARDVIKDFEVQEDVLHLVGWDATSYEQLEIETVKAGKVMVRSGDEALLLQDMARALTATDLDAEHFLFAA